MDIYDIWVDLKPGQRDLDFIEHVGRYLGKLKADGHIEGFRISRRKLGLGIPGLGEFHISIHFRDLTQMDAAFNVVATREGEIERLHLPVYSMVTDFTSALYRDFPDRVRAQLP